MLYLKDVNFCGSSAMYTTLRTIKMSELRSCKVSRAQDRHTYESIKKMQAIFTLAALRIK